MPKALLIIDYTNDFIADQGALTCGRPAQALAPYITHLAEEFYQAGDLDECFPVACAIPKSTRIKIRIIAITR